MSDVAHSPSETTVEPPLSEDIGLHSLKQGDLFAVFNAKGDMHGQLHAVGPSTGADGLFQDDTRILSRFMLSIGGRAPVLLASAVDADNVLFIAHLTNGPFIDCDGRQVGADQIYIERRRVLHRRKLYESLQVRNFGLTPVSLELRLDVDADFKDVFEVRGAKRAARGTLLPPRRDSRSLTLGYRGLDGRVRRTAIAFSCPVQSSPDNLTVPLQLGPRAGWSGILTVTSDEETTAPDRAQFLAAVKAAKRETRRQIRALDRIRADNAGLARWLRRAAADLALLISHLDTGPYPYAGIPWFSVPFGRDAVITALQLLWLEPSIARGVLAYLSAAQAQHESAFQDSQPGKIMHETRKGEMSTLKEVPFARYYGGVDTTPLFVLLAGAYYRRTNDLAFLRQLWPAVQAAIGWIDTFGDSDGDGFVEYLRGEETGLQNQGWKDSSDSVFHSDGALAHGPIALIEVQAYVAAAKAAAAEVAAALGDQALASALTEQSRQLRDKIEARFWCEELGTYALALDGDKRPCAVRASNAGHALFCGVASPERARRVAGQLLSPSFFTGWGVRTLHEGEVRYNPISYHNGTVWPHDCSLLAAGFARYGMTQEAGRIFSGLFEAASRLPAQRLPELFCGFRRRHDEGPISYPSACTPQAWASGAPFLMLQACLGIDVDARDGAIDVRSPYLPDWVNEIHVHEICVGTERVSLCFRRNGAEVETQLTAPAGGVQLRRRDGARDFAVDQVRA